MNTIYISYTYRLYIYIYITPLHACHIFWAKQIPKLFGRIWTNVNPITVRAEWVNKCKQTHKIVMFGHRKSRISPFPWPSHQGKLTTCSRWFCFKMDWPINKTIPYHPRKSCLFYFIVIHQLFGILQCTPFIITNHNQCIYNFFLVRAFLLFRHVSQTRE